MESYPFMRKYGQKMDHNRYDYDLPDHYKYLITRYVTIPTYKLFGGKRNPKLSHAAVGFTWELAHGLIRTPPSIAVIVWALYDKYKNQKVSGAKHPKESP